jgi:hypothetical protein
MADNQIMIINPQIETVNVACIKLPFQTKHFNQNQKVWVRATTGAEAALVTAKRRGRGRWISAWINWRSKEKTRVEFKVFSVSKEFSDRHNLMVVTQDLKKLNR